MMDGFGADLLALSEEKLEALARMLAAEGIEIDSSPAIPRREDPSSLPLSFAQERLWFLGQIAPALPAYNVFAAFWLQGPLNVSALTESLREILRRHEVLRGTFEPVGGRPVQRVAEIPPLVLPVVDLEGLGAAAPAEAEALASREVRRPFDLGRGPLFRALLLRTGARRHALVLCLHHIVTDGWSQRLLSQELSALYRARLWNDPGARPPEPPIQYADFAAWQRRRLQGELLESLLAWWRERLASAPPVLELPTDRPRPPVHSFRGGRETLILPSSLTRALRDLGTREGASLFMTLFAAFGVLLLRWTGQTDLVVGTPTANRRQPELQGLLGLLTDTLVLRTDAAGDPGFCELLERVRDVVIGAMEHEELPLQKLIETLQPERHAGRAPLFQTVFVLQEEPGEDLVLEGLEVAPLWFGTGTAKFDLVLEAAPAGDGLECQIEYSSDLFDPPTIRRLLGHWRTLLESVSADPGRRLSGLAVLSEAERHQLLAEWNSGDRDWPELPGLHRTFETQARRDPGAIALVAAGSGWTYGELDRRANRLAHRLRRLGAGRGTLVGLCLERSPEMILAILGILKAGAAYVPLDPSYPPERLRVLLEDSAVPVVVTCGELSASLETSGPGPRTVCLDRDAALLTEESEAVPGVQITPADAAYVIFTSGSTGRPKGVPVTHGNVARLFAATEPWFGFGPSDVWTLFHSFAFDFSVWEIWGALLYGGRLVVVPYTVSREPELFAELLERERVTVLNQTPSAFRQLLQTDPERLGRLPLRFVVFGGEALDFRSLAPWFDRRGDAGPRLINMYGITETTVHVTYRPVAAADLASPGASRIGRAIPDLSLRLLDRQLQPVPIGVVGELYVGGAGLARGYLNRPALAAERFLPDPFSARPGARLYRTGDLARYRPGGDLEFLGRADHQVKIRGFRIELGEIEAAVLQHPGVRSAAVRAREDRPGDRRLVAYVVPEPGSWAGSGDLLRHLRARLPEHMLPAAIVPLPALPLTAHGKLDIRALPAPGQERPDLGSTYAPPETPAQRAMAEVWQEVLGLERIGIDDNYFALGGDSIRSVQVVALARARGLDLEIQKLFLHQTIRELAGAAGEPAPGAAARTAPFSLLAPGDRDRLPEGLEDAYPLARLQAGMLYHMEAASGAAVYHNVDSFHLRGPLDPGALQRAVDEVVARHPVLRTGFDLASYGEPLQLVHLRAGLPVPVIDLRHLQPGRQEEVLAAFFASERRRPFDLARPPLIRFHIHLRGDDRLQLTLTECHAILDGWSLTSTLAEIFDRYARRLAGEEPPPEPPLSLTYRDFVALEREALAAAEPRRYWRERLEGAVVTRLPRWPGGQAGVTELRRPTLSVPVSEDLFAGLEGVARRAGVPLKSVLLAAHLKALGVVSGASRVMTGLVTHGRPETPEGDAVRGLFLNTVPLHQELADGTWADLARRAFEAEGETLPFRRYPLAEIQREAGGDALFETTFNFVHFRRLDSLGGGGPLEMVELTYSSNQANFTLAATFSLNRLFRESGTPLEVLLQYDTAELRPEQAAAIAGVYRSVLETMAADPEAPHDAPAPLPTALRHAAVVEWNDTRAPFPADRTLPDLFDEQVRRAPHRPAVLFGATCWSYAELGARADRLARSLQRAGVGPESLVGLCLERSPRLVLAILGVLKAGGAYLPLDPDYPPERLAFMLADSRAALVLSEPGAVESLPGERPRTLLLDAAWEAAAAEAEDGPVAAAAPEHLAYVIYTSGSTGRPKGVLIEHRGLSNLSEAQVAAFGPGPEDRVLQFASASFDASIFEIAMALRTGAALVLGSRESLLPGPELQVLLREHAVSNVTLPPSALAVLPVCELPALRTVIVAGEACPADLVDRWQPGRRFFNAYGPTEATVWATVSRCQAGQGKPSIGRPILNGRVYVLDSGLNPVPAGTPGELVLGGPGLSRGYLGRPELTAETLVPDPFGGPGDRLYRTGDLARHLPDGGIEFLGRLDHQVKIRGFRVEPGEIESALRQHPEVREAVVVPVERSGSEPSLAAYLVPREGCSPDLGELRGFLRRHLPPHLVPAFLVPLPALPLSPSGKVDRGALPAPGTERSDPGVAYTAPRSELEKAIAGIWREVLGLDQVGVDDNFFDLGGRSLELIRVNTKLRQVLAREILMTELFRHPTVASLAAHLQPDGAEVSAAAEGDERAARRRALLGRRAAGASTEVEP